MTDNDKEAGGLLLAGLDGANPLAFLAALGTLRGLSIVWPDREVRLCWSMEDVWRPRIHGTKGGLSQEAVLDGLEVFMDMRPGHHALTIGDNLNVGPTEFRTASHRAVDSATSSWSGRAEADFLSSFACDVIEDRNHMVQDTALRTLRGAGHQHFLKSMWDLTENTTRAHLERALFHPWRREDQRFSLRWDPEDDRRYAHRWRDPSKEAAGTEWGANRLAFEALPLFPVAPEGRSLRTTGFRGYRASNTFFTLPIWDCPVGLDSVRSLLCHSQLQNNRPDRTELAPIGVTEIFRSRRLNVGQYRNFGQSRSV